MPVATAPAHLESALRHADDLADTWFANQHVPGLAYGVLLGDRLIHTRGLGTLRAGERALPDGDSVFRIASMTKSFTAATVLLLRDEGRLALDDPVARFVPELAELSGPTSDSPPITVRHLLTMTSGLPSDDPWGDRQQGLDLAAFAELLRGGLTFAFAPGSRYEYSNLGYGILGRVITNVAGREYRDVVRERILEPLGMASSTFLLEEVEPERLALGHLWRDDGYLTEPIDGYGALAAMGGLFTTVSDLARWVAGFLDAEPARDDPEGNHPLRRASRREMQGAMVPIGLRLDHASTDAPPDVESGHYGFGLFVIDDLRLGRMVAHGGGYPGFGSHMRWHPASGIGVIAMGNARYTPTTPLVKDIVRELLRSEAAPSRRPAPAAATLDARAAVERLLDAWDDELAARLFAMNVELDEPMERRRAEIARLRAVHGTLRSDPAEPVHCKTPLHLAWWLTGERGRVRVEILLTPERPPRVQTLALSSVPEPPLELRDAATRVVAALVAPGGLGSHPTADLPLAPGVDRSALARSLRATEARFGTVRLGAVTAGDGTRRATFALECARDRVDLALEWDPAARMLTSVTLVPAQVRAPDLE